MAKLTQAQIVEIKNHILTEGEALKIKFKAKNAQFESQKVLHSEVEFWEKQGWIAGTPLKTKTPITHKKRYDIQFEDDVWCMFYNLGFRILNSDEKLHIQWGENSGDKKQIDVLAVGEDAIFVVECKCAENPKSTSFKKELTEMSTYMKGMTESLRQMYGPDKRVKFIFATRNYRIADDGEDAQRMKDSGIYHLDENGYNYITHLITSYQSSVIYQFYGIMFKDELIGDKPITIPALKGKMGNDKDYYLFSIEPHTLLKIGFVLHRTKVNDSMAPTYQRLLVPKRLKGITKFIDEEKGYFPNSIIINFADPTDEIKTTFEPIHKEKDSNAEFGLLNIPNAYGIAYIIDGQHRVYGYANSKFKNIHTIPVVAFQGMASEEQLKIFMEINENQKSVSKNLRIDLEEDLFWTSTRLDSRMKALRSSIIKMLSGQSNNVLFNKISIGEDQSLLSSVFFEKALLHSGLLPKASQTKWAGDTASTLYDINQTDINKAMVDSRKRVVQFINGCYEVAEKEMTEETKGTFLFSNRATYPFITLAGLLHSFLISCGTINSDSHIKNRIEAITPYIETLCQGLNNLPKEEKTYLTGAQGQGAEKKWLLSYQNIINKSYSDYFPEELKVWRETRDQSIQDEGEDLKNEIRQLVRELVFLRLQEVYGKEYEKNIIKLKNSCEGKIINAYGDSDDFDPDAHDWRDWIEVSDYKEIISKNYSYPSFADTFGIKLSDNANSKKEKLSWMSSIEIQKGKKKNPLTRSDVNRLWLIRNHLNSFKPQE